MKQGMSWSDLRKSEKQQAEAGEYYNSALLSRTSVPIMRGKAASTPGAHPLAADTLHDHLHKGSFSILTAQNPGGKKSTHFQNGLSNNAMEQDLKRMGAIYHRVKGKYGHEEDSFLVHHTKGVHPTDLENLAEKHGQESILHSSQGKPRLKYVTGQNKGMHHPHVEGQETYTSQVGAHDNFTMLPNKPESKFSANLDFGSMRKSEHHKQYLYEIETADKGKHHIAFHIDHSSLKG